jgi:hypothetical protein
MRFNCNLQNLSGCRHEQDGRCLHPARKIDPVHCADYLEDDEYKEEGFCKRAE